MSSSTSPLPEDLSRLFEYIDSKQALYIDELREAVAVESVWPDNLSGTNSVINWVADKLRTLGVEVEVIDVGTKSLPDGRVVPLPNVILGSLGNDPTKKTVCVYGHLDVVAAARADGWNTDPFELTEKDGKLYGRGTTDDKGPVLCWLHAIEGYQAVGIPLPVNLRIIFEGMEENGSSGLEQLLATRKDDFLKSIDFVCVSDNYWLGKEKPCLTYGLRGLCFFGIEIECASKDLHSGVFGGNVYEAMSDLVYILGTLVEKDGRILIDGIYDEVAPETDEERRAIETISLDVDALRTNLGAKKLTYNEDKVQLLLHRWRYPSLSIHGIEGAYSEPGTKTIIPHKVTGRFSIRLVPNQTPDSVAPLVFKHLNAKWEERGSPNAFRTFLANSGKPWISDPTHPNYEAARKATKHAYRVEPDFTREGGSIPVAMTLQNATGKNVLLIPVGAGDDGAHSQNEKIDIRNYIGGTKLLGAYLYEIAKLE